MVANDIDSDIEKTVRRCTDCQSVQSAPPVAPLQPWKWPTCPWSRVHIDFAGPFQNKLFLVVVDAHSKWVEAKVVSSTSSAAAINNLRALFGLPELIVSDNGPAFTSQEFKYFMRKNGIKHTKSAPYYPLTNSVAERAVQVVKQGLKKYKEDTMEERLAKVLFTYRITPHITTGVPPAELLLGRKLRSRLDLVYPNLEGRVEQRQLRQKLSHDGKSKPRSLQIGDSVLVRNHSGTARWLTGVIVSQSGPLLYQVDVQGQLRRCHLDQLRQCEAESSIVEPSSSPLEIDSPSCLPDCTPQTNRDRPAGTTQTQVAPRTYPLRQN